MEINAESVYIGESGAFGLNNLLTNVTIRSKEVRMGASVFSDNAPLTHVMFNKSATIIEVDFLPKLYKKYACDEASVSVDAIRATRIHSRSLLHFLPALLVNLDLATALSRTRDYAHSAHLVDTLIIQHRLFVSNASRGSMALHSAQAILMSVNLASQVSMLQQRVQVSCLKCPSGSACPDYSTSSYIPCPLGRYNSFAGATNCSACPQGKYGPYKGAAICLDCPKGKFGPRNGSIALDECEDCPAGKYSPSDGLYSCTSCSKAEYQPEKGQSSCLECQGVGEIGDAKRTGCMTDPSIANFATQHSLKNYFPRESLFTSLSLLQRYLLLPSSWSISKRLVQ